MTLRILADHTEKSGSNLLNHVTSANMTCGAGVTGGGANGTLHDQGTSADEVITSDVSADSAAYSGVIWFKFNGTPGGTPYTSLVSRGGVFEDDSRFAIGFRPNGEGNGLIGFMYRRDGSSLGGAEGGAGFPVLEVGRTYRWAFRWGASGGAVYVDEASVLTTGDSLGTDGSQSIKLAGPNSFNSSDSTASVEILYSAVWDEYLAEVDLLAASDDPTTLFASGDAEVTGDVALAPIVAAGTIAVADPSINLYLTSAVSVGSNFGALQVGGSAPATAPTTTGWQVGATPANKYAAMAFGTKRSTAAWGDTALPNGAPNPSLGDAWRSDVLTKDVAAGEWSFALPLIADTIEGASLRARVRVWKSTDESSWTEITESTVILSTVTNLQDDAAQISSGAVELPSFSLSSERLYIQVAAETVDIAGDILPGPNLPEGMTLVLATKFLEAPPIYPSVAEEGYFLWEGQSAGGVVLTPEGRGIRTIFPQYFGAGSGPPNSNLSIGAAVTGALLPTVGPGEKQYITGQVRHSTNWADGEGDPGVNDNWTAGTKLWFLYSSVREDVNNIISFGTVGRDGHNPGIVNLIERPNGGGAEVPVEIALTTAEIRNGLYKRYELILTYPSGPGIADGEVAIAWDGGTPDIATGIRFEEAGSTVQWFMNAIYQGKTYGGAPVGHPGPPEDMHIEDQDLMVYNQAA